MNSHELYVSNEAFRLSTVTSSDGLIKKDLEGSVLGQIEIFSQHCSGANREINENPNYV